MRHTISVLVENKFGVLTRVAGLFSGRGYNIDSLTVSETESQKHLSRITIVMTDKSLGLMESGSDEDRYGWEPRAKQLYDVLEEARRKGPRP